MGFGFRPLITYGVVWLVAKATLFLFGAIWLGRALSPRLFHVASRLQAHAQRALSYSVNGRYDLANRELNAIAAVVEP